MGSSTLLFIGDDRQDQFERFQSMEYAFPLNPHIVEIDRLEVLRARYATATHGEESFERWAAKWHGLAVVPPGQEPDRMNEHRWGWMRRNEAGEIVELVQRDIPGSLNYFFFLNASDGFLLKPGAVGWDIDGNHVATEVTEGFAGAARLRDIDLEGMRGRKTQDYEARWDAVHRAAQGETWLPFVEISKRHPQGPSYSHAIYLQAAREWFAQTPLQRAYAANCTSDHTHQALDPMLLPREDYVAHFRRRLCALDYDDVVKHWKYLEKPDEADILAGLDDDALLVSVLAKS